MNFLTTGQRIKKHVWNDLSSFFEKNYEQEACNPCERRHVQEILGDHQNILSGYNIEERRLRAHLNKPLWERTLRRFGCGLILNAEE